MFLNFIIKDKLYSAVEGVGVYGDDAQATDKLNHVEASNKYYTGINCESKGVFVAYGFGSFFVSERMIIL